MKEKTKKKETSLRQFKKRQYQDSVEWCLDEAKYYQGAAKRYQGMMEAAQKEAEWRQYKAKRYQGEADK